MTAKKKQLKERWLIVAWNNGGEHAPRLWSVDEEGEVLSSESAALKLVKTLTAHDNVIVAKMSHHYQTKRVMEKMK
jgi:hypothetical protein